MNKLRKFLTQVIPVPVWAFLSLPLLAYAAWEAFWYWHVGLRFIKWHTHLMVYVYLWILGVTVLQLCARDRSSTRFSNGTLAFSSLIFTLILAELSLEITDFNKTYLEKVSGQYSSPYAPENKTLYHAWPASANEHWIAKPEYRHWRPTNSHGIGDREWSVNKALGERRLLALGDSFTEGDGAPYDSSYVALLDTLLHRNNYSFYTMNGGVCGSDPFYNFIHLRDKLLIYQPDIVIQSISTQDLTTDIIIRGGFERFGSDGRLRFRKAPWWEPIYALSYISRLFFNYAGYGELLRKGGISVEEEQELNRQIIDLFREYAELCKNNNIRLIAVLRPDHTEILHNKYEYDFTAIMNSLKSNTPPVQAVDLLPCYQAYIASSRTHPSDYFWKNDGHHNPKGYLMMAHCIFNAMEPVWKNPD